MMDNVNERLNSESQVAISKMVSSLKDEPLSMVWRSDLNESLRAVASKTKKRRFVFNFLSPVAGLSVACALAVVVIVRPAQTTHPLAPIPTVSSPSSSLEASLFQEQQDDVRISDVAGAGLNPTEAANNASSKTQSSQDELEDDIQL